MVTQIVYPAGGWLPAGAHLELEWDDQGRDFSTDWQGIVQAPGDGQCINVLSDRPFPSGFGPRYPVVRIDTGAFAGHEFYIGHNTSLVSDGESFKFGHPLARADQGHNWSGTTGGWVELGEAFGGSPGPKSGVKWFDHLLDQPLVVNVPDPFFQRGDKGPGVWLLTHRLAVAGWLPHSGLFYNLHVQNVVRAFQQFHKLTPYTGIAGPRTQAAIKASAEAARKTGKREIPRPL